MQKIIKAVFLYILLASGNCLLSQEYLPTSTSNQIVKHTNYVISYDESHEQAEWVAYRLTSANLSGTASRTDNFRADPAVTSGSAALADYKGSGYDRGHLCPAGDMTFSKDAMSESFYMSNMSPQDPSFNRGIWKKIESQVRDWAGKEEEIIIVTGPIFKSNKGSIGANEVTVPGSYFKVVYDVTGDQKMIGFILPNQKGEKEIKEYAVSINEIESLTGIDFFYQMLPNRKEEELESLVALSDWGLAPPELTSSDITTTYPENNSALMLIIFASIIVAILVFLSYLRKAGYLGKRR